jgi:hypothetical protein
MQRRSLPRRAGTWRVLASRVRVGWAKIEGPLRTLAYFKKRGSSELQALAVSGWVSHYGCHLPSVVYTTLIEAPLAQNHPRPARAARVRACAARRALLSHCVSSSKSLSRMQPDADPRWPKRGGLGQP